MLKFLSGMLVGLVLAFAVVSAVIFLAPDTGPASTRVAKAKPAKDTEAVPVAEDAPAAQ